jgi:predicted 3-demethylubiquinone-9 3-methyltransferase (glyoxalase superfamily)
MFCREHHGQAEEAVRFYVSLFPNATLTVLEQFGPGEREPEGTCKRALFEIAGQEFMAMDNAGPHKFTFTPAVSLFVTAESEAETKRLFDALADRGEVLMPLDNYGFSKAFGWVNDRFGVSWQVNCENENARE